MPIWLSEIDWIILPDNWTHCPNCGKPAIIDQGIIKCRCKGYRFCKHCGKPFLYDTPKYGGVFCPQCRQIRLCENCNTDGTNHILQTRPPIIFYPKFKLFLCRNCYAKLGSQSYSVDHFGQIE